MKFLHKYIISMFFLMISMNSFTQSNQQSDGGLDLPLHRIILNSHYTRSEKIDAMRKILDNQSVVDINMLDKDGRTALNLATYYKQDPVIINFLINYGAKVNEPDHFNVTPLHNSIKYENIPVAQILLAGGANEFHKDDNGLTPIDLARTENTKDVLGLEN